MAEKKKNRRARSSKPRAEAVGEGKAKPGATERPEVVDADFVELGSAEPDEADAAEPSPEELASEETPADSDLPPLGGAESHDEGEGEHGEVHEEEARHDSKRALAPIERSLVRHDPLTQYVQEMRRYPLLTREEEHELAVAYFERGDLNAARRLVESNLRLVVKIAHEYRRAYRNLLDLVQEGNVGLMQAVKKYDPYRGVKLSSYAAWWIRAYILKFILNNWRLVKIGTTQAQRKLFFNLRKEREKLEKDGFVPEAKLLAERLKVTEQEVNEMESRLGGSDLSLDAPVGREDEGGRTQLDLVQGGTRPDVQIEGKEFTEMLREQLEAFGQRLTGRERTLFEERLLNDSPLTLQEIGEKYGISRERARQIEARLKAKLETYLRERLGDAIDIALGTRE